MNSQPRKLSLFFYIITMCVLASCLVIVLSLHNLSRNFNRSSTPQLSSRLQELCNSSPSDVHQQEKAENGESPDQRKVDLRSGRGDIRVDSPEDDATGLRDFRNAQQVSQRPRQWLLNPSDRRPPQLTQVNCTDFIQNRHSAQHHGIVDYEGLGNSSRVSRQPRTLRQLLEVTENCTSYLLTSGFRFARVSEEELSFPLAFSIMVYKDLEQVERLLRAVYRPHNVYCIHADRKSSTDFLSGLRHLASCMPNVFLTERSVAVKWGTISVLEPEVQCMRQLLAHRTPWRYFINLTGQEFPLKTNRELVRILRAFQGANIISGTTDKMFEFRWKNSKPVPYNLTMNKGDVHIIASRGYVDYVTNSRVARDLYEWLRNSFIPDESFFSTLNFNPQLGVPGSYTGPVEQRSHQTVRSLKLWQYSSSQCRGKWVRAICHFGVGDLPTLTSSPFLIANKFSYDFQPLAYDCLEKWYFDKVRQENDGVITPLDMAVYKRSEKVRYRYSGPVLIWE